jgi:hypothetical protein
MNSVLLCNTRRISSRTLGAGARAPLFRTEYNVSTTNGVLSREMCI